MRAAYLKRCLALLIVFGVSGAVFKPTSALAQSGPPPVDVALPIVEKIVDWDEFTGRFEAARRVDIRPRVSGFLEEIKFNDGQIVKKDDLLFVIDARLFKAELDRAKAELDAAKAEQTRALSQLARGRELVSRQALAQSELDERLANRLRADAQVAIAEAAIREAELNVEFTEVRAPFDGRISDRKVDVGALLTQNETLLATVIALDPIHLVFTGSEADFLKYSRLRNRGGRESARTAANPVEARLIDEQGWPHKGKLDFVDNELDANSGTIRARGVFANSDDLFAPGLFARLRLIGSPEYEAMLLPDEAILSDQARKIVLIADAEGNVTVKTVTTGPIYKGKRVIRSGIVATDRVIVAGVQRARPGGKVMPQKVELSLDAAPDAADFPAPAQ